MTRGLAPWLARAALLPAARSQVELLHRAHQVLAPDGPFARLVGGLPRLLAQLGRRRVRRTVTGPTVRGRVDWPSTIRARHAARGEPLALVSRVSERDLDVRENQLLRRVLRDHRRLVDELPAAVRAGTLLARAEHVAAIPIAARLRELTAALDEPALHRRLATIRLPERVDRRWTDACRASDVREYELVARAWEAWVIPKDGLAPIARPAPFVILPADPDDPAAAPWMALAARRLAPVRPARR